MDDQQFLQAFERGEYHQLDGFSHYAHVRLAWLYLRNNGWDIGTQKIREGIQRVAKAHGAPQKYHETMTMFWTHIVNIHLLRSTQISEFSEFAAQYPQLFDTGIVSRHYSSELLWSISARQTWVEPDLKPLTVPR
jgi:hypothetical protein